MASEEEIIIILNGLRSHIDTLEAALPNVKESGTYDLIESYAITAKGCVELAITTAQNE